MLVSFLEHAGQTAEVWRHPTLFQFYVKFSDGHKLFYNLKNNLFEVEENVNNYLTLLSKRV